MAEIRELSLKEFMERKRREKTYCVKEVAQLLGCSESSVYRMLYEGKLIGYRYNWRIWIFESDLEAANIKHTLE